MRFRMTFGLARKGIQQLTHVRVFERGNGVVQAIKGGLDKVAHVHVGQLVVRGELLCKERLARSGRAHHGNLERLAAIRNVPA
jgi:hypothetical protein